jgi:hypothetical protein
MGQLLFIMLRFLPFVLILMSFPVFSQGTVKGTITDSGTGEPIIGAYILLISDPSIGAVSDLDGNYSVELPNGDHKLITSSPE